MTQKKVYFIGPTEVFDTNDLYINSNIQECVNWIQDKPIISLDTETEGFFDHKNRIIMLQLSDGIDVWVIDTRNNSEVFKLLKPYLESKLILGQNLKFDYKFLKFEGIELDSIYDTFLAECILTNGLDNRELGLGAIARKYCDKYLDKSIRNQFIGLKGQPFTNKQILYGSEDVLYLFEIREKQLQEINKWELNEWLDLENNVCLAIADIEYNGIGLDIERWIALAEASENKIPEYEKELDEMVRKESRLSRFVLKYVQNDLFGGFGRDVNIKWSSPTQIFNVVKDLGLQVQSTSEKEIARYQYDEPLIKKFIDYKKEAKLASTYGKNFINFINPQTHRVHGEFWQILNTGRVSCGGSKSGGKSSVNLQNLPAKNTYLNCFTAEKGKKIIGIDYSAQEGRIAADLSKDKVWLDTFKNDKDLHAEVCKMMFGITDDLVRTYPDFLRGKSYRDVAKTINFMALFGGSEFKLSKILQNTKEESKLLLNKYHGATSGLKLFLDKCATYALNRGYIRSPKPLSMIRWFEDWHPNLDPYKDSKLIGSITRAAYNTPIQAGGALVTKLALVNIRKYIKEHNLQDKVKLIHVVHDCTMTECDADIAEEFSKIQSDIMVEAGKVIVNDLLLLTEISINDYWSK